ncbi:MAG TPA: hypothetical protein EYN00_08830, partial [Planctomycetes bacterium]|nr:hypothetical protein [Planctomycetota bacterium]
MFRLGSALPVEIPSRSLPLLLSIALGIPALALPALVLPTVVLASADQSESVIVTDEERQKAASKALEILQKELRAAQDEYYRPYSEAETDEERNAIELDPTQDPTSSFIGRFLQLADEHPGTGPAIEALGTVISLARRGPEGSDSSALKKAVAIILEKYLDHPALTDLIRFAHYRGASEINVSLLEDLIEKSSHRPTVACATYSLAKLLGESPTTRKRARAL